MADEDELPRTVTDLVAQVCNPPSNLADLNVLHVHTNANANASGMSLGPICHDLNFLATNFPPLVNKYGGEVELNCNPWKNDKRNWPPTRRQEFLDWFTRIEQHKAFDLKAKGLYHFMQFVRYPVPMNESFMCALTSFWSTSSNAFHFKSGMMTPTLLDLAILFGLKPYGSPVDASLDKKKSAGMKKDFNWKIDSYTNWLATYREKSGSVQPKEYVAFLLYWISKYVVGSPSFQIDPSQFSLAYHLGVLSPEDLGTVALGEYVLANLYHGLHRALSSNFKTWGGPLWILQVWGYAYFPKVRPALETTTNDFELQVYGIQFMHGLPPYFDLPTYIGYFYNCHLDVVEQSSILRLMMDKPIGPDWLREAIFHSENVRARNFWMHCLTARDLAHKVAIGNKGNPRCGVEMYNPHFVSLQFGLGQSLPFPMRTTWNAGFLVRRPILEKEDVTHIQAMNSYLTSKYKARLVNYPLGPIRTYTVDPNFVVFWDKFMSTRKSLANFVEGYGLISEHVESTSSGPLADVLASSIPKEKRSKRKHYYSQNEGPSKKKVKTSNAKSGGVSTKATRDHQAKKPATTRRSRSIRVRQQDGMTKDPFVKDLTAAYASTVSQSVTKQALDHDESHEGLDIDLQPLDFKRGDYKHAEGEHVAISSAHIKTIAAEIGLPLPDDDDDLSFSFEDDVEMIASQKSVEVSLPPVTWVSNVKKARLFVQSKLRHKNLHVLVEEDFFEFLEALEVLKKDAIPNSSEDKNIGFMLEETPILVSKLTSVNNKIMDVKAQLDELTADQSALEGEKETVELQEKEYNSKKKKVIEILRTVCEKKVAIEKLQKEIDEAREEAAKEGNLEELKAAAVASFQTWFTKKKDLKKRQEKKSLLEQHKVDAEKSNDDILCHWQQILESHPIGL